MEQLCVRLCEALGLTTPEGSARVREEAQTAAAESGLGDEEAYAQLVESDSLAYQTLLERIVVGETWFFREPDSLELVVREVSRKGRACRILCAPCSTGEEPYSLAMMLLEAGLGECSIHAMDISHKALEQAALGVYTKASFRQAAFEPLQRRYFQPEGQRWALSPLVKERVQFFAGNLLEPHALAHRSPYDVVLCRNLLIYLDAWARKRLFEALGRALGAEGLLVVGVCEALSAPSEGFTLVSESRGPVLRKPANRVRPLPPPRLTPERQGLPFLPRAGPAGFQPSSPRARAVPDQYRRDPAPPVQRPRDLLVEAQRMADQGLLETAVELCEHFLRERGPAAQAYFLLGVVHSASGRLERAEHYLRRAIYLDPHHVEALTHLALQAEKEGRKEAADRYWRRAQGAVAPPR